MAKRCKKEPVEQVGDFEFTIRFSEPTPESVERWERRSDALFVWLLEQWNREQAAKARQAEDTRGGPSSP